MSSEYDYDVAVVGYGPTGELLAILLGRLGYRVGVFERWFDIYDLPRAVHFDDEVGRIFQAAGLRDEVLAITDPVPDFYEWRNRHGKALLKIDWARAGLQGWPTANFFTQPELQRVLDHKARTVPSAEVFTGWEVRAIENRGDHVVFSAHRGQQEPTGAWVATGEARDVSTRYLVGADGANSAVRQAIGSEFHDLGFVPFDWLILDVVPHDQQRVWSPMNWQLCDPTRPTTIVSGGPRRRRWEFMRLPGETIEELNTEETAWRLLEPWGITRETAVLERHAVYRFMARYAESWRNGRILLAGDAAHLMPPFAGQGMCAGLRDCVNLAWKLDLIMSRRAPDDLLDSYQRERLDHVRQWIDFSAALGEVICVLDEDQAAARDARMLAGDADPMRVLPAAPPHRLGTGLFLHTQPDAGVHFIQATVGLDSSEGLFDDVIGHGFVLLGAHATALADLDDAHLAILHTLGAHCAWIAGDATGETANRGAGFRDVTGAYGEWFAAHGCVSVLIRPDFYVFGVAHTPAAVPELIDALAESLRLIPTTVGLPS